MNRCVRCWEEIEEKNPNKSVLRCDYCRKLVDEDFKRKKFRPFDWYFNYYKNIRWQKKN